MKSQALTTAWILFRKYQITFSQALREAWLRVKKEAIRIAFSQTKPDEISYRQRLVERYNSMKITFFVTRPELIIDVNSDNLIGRYESWMQ